MSARRFLAAVQVLAWMVIVARVVNILAQRINTTPLAVRATTIAAIPTIFLWHGALAASLSVSKIYLSLQGPNQSYGFSWNCLSLKDWNQITEQTFSRQSLACGYLISKSRLMMFKGHGKIVVNTTHRDRTYRSRKSSNHIRAIRKSKTLCNLVLGHARGDRHWDGLLRKYWNAADTVSIRSDKLVTNRVLFINNVHWRNIGNNLKIGGNEKCGSRAAIMNDKFYCGIQRAVVPFQGLNRGRFLEENPRPPLTFHFIQLALHKTALPVRITTRNANSQETYYGGDPQTANSPTLPKPIAFFLGSILIVAMFKLLFYSFDRGGKIFYMVFFGGFPLAFLGVALVVFCFLPDPPPIFWFKIGAHWLPTVVTGLPV